eukprot:1976936-Rhodomonas_salina.3
MVGSRYEGKMVTSVAEHKILVNNLRRSTTTTIHLEVNFLSFFLSLAMSSGQGHVSIEDGSGKKLPIRGFRKSGSKLVSFPDRIVFSMPPLDRGEWLLTDAMLPRRRSLGSHSSRFYTAFWQGAYISHYKALLHRAQVAPSRPSSILLQPNVF